MEEIVYDGGWLRVKKTPRGYLYAERKGRDSVAVLLFRWIATGGIAPAAEVLIRKQPLPVRGLQEHDDKVVTLFPCPITGGVEEGENYRDCAIREVEEEAGYIIPADEMIWAGSYIASTQSNEEVFCFVANVTGKESSLGAQDGSYFESKSHNEWKLLATLEDKMTMEYAGLVILVNRLRDMLGKGIRQ